MKARMNIGSVEPRIYKAMDESDKQLDNFQLDAKLRELIRIRASQLNGCGYCVNMHSRDARKLGETEQRLYAVSTWWETPFFTEEERTVLKLTEEITLISRGGVSDAVYANALQILGQQKLAQVIFVIVTINSWNRIAVSTHMVAEKE